MISEQKRLVSRILDGIVSDNSDPCSTKYSILGEVELSAIEAASQFIKQSIQPEPACIGGRCVG